jgi:hypothetical protein
MVDIYALTADPLPAALHGSDAEYSLRTLSDWERLAVEDFFYREGERIALSPAITAVIMPQTQTANASMGDFAVLVESSLGILAVSGFQPVSYVATLTTSTCVSALRRPPQEKSAPPVFPKKLIKAAPSTWVHHFFDVHRREKGGLHITADRFVRYLRAGTSLDALVDLCICLESLIESETEINFRFATCLAKISGIGRAEDAYDLLHDLYSLRSKVVHGSDSAAAYRKIMPNIFHLRKIARAILTHYVLYMAEHTKEEWKKHLRNTLLA